MSPLRRFCTVELPLQLFLRSFLGHEGHYLDVALTIGAFIGVRSLTLFTDGFQRGSTVEVLAGLVMTIALALLSDITLQWA